MCVKHVWIIGVWSPIVYFPYLNYKRTNSPINCNDCGKPNILLLKSNGTYSYLNNLPTFHSCNPILHQIDEIY